KNWPAPVYRSCLIARTRLSSKRLIMFLRKTRTSTAAWPETVVDLVRASGRLAPAAAAFGQQARDDLGVAGGVGAVAARRVPVHALLAVAAGMGDAQVQQVVRAALCARHDVLDVCAQAGARVKG